MNRKHTVDTLFVFLLYGLFALLSVLLILIGARVYRRTVENTEARGDVRASLSYVANKIRSSDRAALETRSGLSVLVLTQRAGEEDFETCIYYTGGALKEYLTEAEAPFYPEKGETVTALTAFSFAEEDGLLIVTSVIDNMVKGAAGQAIQNMNILFGLPEETGIDMIPPAF